MRKIVFDIETSDASFTVEPKDMDLSVIAIYDSLEDSYTAFTKEELPKLWPIIEQADMLIGYNSNHFDLPILDKYYPGNLMDIKSLDILEEIKKTLGRRLKLEKIARGTLGHGKSGDGLEAVRLWKAGEVEKVKKYCIEDVRITKEVYDYALKNKGLKYKEGNETRNIELDTSDWEEENQASLTHTMPF